MREQKAKYQVVDDYVLNKFNDYRNRKLAVDNSDLKIWAQEAYNLYRDTDLANVQSFSASDGYLENFKKRNNIVKQRVTTVGQKVSKSIQSMSLLNVGLSLIG